MTRYIFSTILVFAGVVSPLKGKTTPAARPVSAASAAKGTKSIPAPSSITAADAKTQKHDKVVVATVTSDSSRASRSALVASHQPAAAAAPAVIRSGRVVAAGSPAAHVTHTTPAPSKNTFISATISETTPVRTSSGDDVTSASGERLARVTAYWRGEGDYYTGRCLSATGVRLHDGHCAVDPNIIPYGSVVDIKGFGKFLAVDTGSAVISRTAAREGGQTTAERHAIVVDIFFEDRSEGERFAAGDAKYVQISWWTPSSLGSDARAARSLFAEEDWTKIQGKQL